MEKQYLIPRGKKTSHNLHKNCQIHKNQNQNQRMTYYMMVTLIFLRESLTNQTTEPHVEPIPKNPKPQTNDTDHPKNKPNKITT